MAPETDAQTRAPRSARTPAMAVQALPPIVLQAQFAASVIWPAAVSWAPAGAPRRRAAAGAPRSAPGGSAPSEYTACGRAASDGHRGGALRGGGLNVLANGGGDLGLSGQLAGDEDVARRDVRRRVGDMDALHLREVRARVDARLTPVDRYLRHLGPPRA